MGNYSMLINKKDDTKMLISYKVIYKFRPLLPKYNISDIEQTIFKKA